jgi:hypothetical protein
MGWAVQSWVSGGAAQGAALTIDTVVQARLWDQDSDWNTPLGSPFAPLHQPLPAARGMLDDETAVTLGHGYLAGAPSAAGARRNIEDWLKRSYEAVLHIDYQQKTSWPPLWTNQLLPPIAARGSQELLPIRMQQQRERAAFWATTTQEGLRWMHPSLMPLANYGDEICRILSEVQRHLLEPTIDGGVTWQLWTAEEVQQAFLLRLNRYLLETGILRKEETDAASDGTALLSQDVLEVRRVQWRYSDRRKAPRGLTRIDHKQADSAAIGEWDEDAGEGEPISYREEVTGQDTMIIQTYPKPDDNGELGVRYVPYGNVIFDSCGTLPIPRMLTWVVKWGLIADLLKKEGEANDPVRAQAAEAIYKRGVSITRVLLGNEV